MTPLERKVARRTGTLIYEARQRLNLTQAAFGKKIQASQGLVSKFEGGIALPSLVEWIRFCELTGTACDAFWDLAKAVDGNRRNA